MFNHEILGDGLVYYTNLIKDPYKIIEEIESLDNKIANDVENGIPLSLISHVWFNWNYGSGKEELHFCKQKKITRSEDMLVKDKYLEDHMAISNKLYSALDSAFDHYSKTLYPHASRNIKTAETLMSILKYEKAGYLPPHTDQGSSSRCLSVVLYLNDDYDGGEISFPHVRNGVSIKPEAGSAIFFPSNYVFVHEVSEIKNGIRYALPNWYHNMTNRIHTDGSE